MQSGGGHRAVIEVTLDNGEVLTEKRSDPGAVLRVLDDDAEPRLLIEVEVPNGDPISLARHVFQLFHSRAHLRVVVGLKFFKRRQDGLFAGVVFVWEKKSDDNSIFVKCIRDIGPLPSDMASRRELAEFSRGNHVDFTAVATADGTSFNVTGLPEALEYPLPRACPAELDGHFTINIAQDLLYHGCERTPLRKRRSLRGVIELPQTRPSKSTSSACCRPSINSKRRTSKQGSVQCRKKNPRLTIATHRRPSAPAVSNRRSGVRCCGFSKAARSLSSRKK